ncbi:MAG: alpha-hydroxy acid oxidase [Acidimicrobiia bacterium]
MTKRQIPTWSAFAPLLKPVRRSGTRRQRRVARDADVHDLRRRARRRTPRAVFDYVDGAAADEISLGRSRALFRDLEFRPGVLRDVSRCDPSTDILGVRAAAPLGFAPTGFTRMMHHEGEPAVARVAQRSGIPYALSTMGTSTPEDVADAAPGADRWFQLYMWRRRDVPLSLMERARACGFRVLVVTVDIPVGGPRLRDVRNGFDIPPALTLRTFVDGALHPNWWIDFLTTEPLSFASLSDLGGTVEESANQIFDPSLDFDDLEWLVKEWDGPVVVKGLQSVDDARRVVDIGAKAVVISNHGGRQLDRSPIPLMMLRPVVDEIGDEAEVYVDGGIMNGADVVAAVALGANACFVGRAYLYGLMAGGEDGVQRVADMLMADIERTMKLLGVTAVEDLSPDHVQLP